MIVKVDDPDDLIPREALEVEDVAGGQHLGERVEPLIVRDADVVVPQVIVPGVLHLGVVVRIGTRNVGGGLQLARQAAKAIRLAILNELDDF